MRMPYASENVDPQMTHINIIHEMACVSPVFKHFHICGIPANTFITPPVNPIASIVFIIVGINNGL